MSTVTYRRQIDDDGWLDIRRATYEYYDGSNANGSLNDLMRVRIQEPVGGTWANIQQSYYRYYKSGDAKGFVHGLRYVVEPDGYAAMLAAELDPTTVSNTVLLQYAKYYFEYNDDRRVTKEIVDRGSLTTSFEYTTSTHIDGLSHWKRKTVETRPDGVTQTVYTNYIGEGLLSELQSGTDHWLRANAYDDQGRLIEVATPSAIFNYDPDAADLGIVLRSDAGLIELSSYYSSTGSGAADGYLESTSLKHGSGGTPVLQSHFEYVALPLVTSRSSQFLNGHSIATMTAAGK